MDDLEKTKEIKRERTLESLEAAISVSIGVLQAASNYDGVETLKHVLEVSLKEVK